MNLTTASVLDEWIVIQCLEDITWLRGGGLSILRHAKIRNFSSSIEQHFVNEWNIFQQFNSTPKGVPSPLLPFQGSLNLSVRVQETVAYHLASNFEYSERNVNNGKVIFSGEIAECPAHLTSKFKRWSSSPSLIQSMPSNVTYACSHTDSVVQY